jgi:hypothetical protein
MGEQIMNSPAKITRSAELLETIKPDLLRMLESAPSFGSCGIEICFHNSEIVKLLMKAEVSKVRSTEKPGSFVTVK